MQCAWDAYLKILPEQIRADVDKLGKHTLQELRLRINCPVELILSTGSSVLSHITTGKDILYCINAATGYSPWAAETMVNGYITAPGGHRIGVCGTAISEKGFITGVRDPTMLCIRVARDFPDIAKGFAIHGKSVLVIGPPGCGKTTFLRDMIRRYSNECDRSICVIDERGELFPFIKETCCYPIGKRTDVLSGYGKKDGIQIALRCMGPGAIAVDEITVAEDCVSLHEAGWCGVNLFATAHAASRADLFTRAIYKPLLESKLFDTLIILHKNKTWVAERMNI